MTGWPLYEVFVRGKRGLNHVHVGSLHAADDEMALRITEFMGATRNADILAECVSASRHVLAREYYKALMSARKLVDYEEGLGNVASSVPAGGHKG